MPKKSWTAKQWWNWWWHKEHPKPPVSPPKPPSPPPVPPSWNLPGPVVFTAWDSTAARTGNWLIANIVVQGVAPIWAIPPGGLIAQAEGQVQYQSGVDYLANHSSLMNRSLVTTLGLDPTYALSKGVNTVFVEAYQNEDPTHTPERMVWQAKHDGWPYAIPVVGCYHGYPLSSYDLSAYGKSFAVYLAEEMSDDDWATLTKIANAS